jgi:hypothetical protein
MIRPLILTAALFLGGTRVRAQAPVARDSLTARFAGLWDGRFVSDHGPEGVMQVTVARDSGWTVGVEMAHDGHEISTRAGGVKVVGQTISWNLYIVDMTCRVTATVDGDSMSGDGDCGTMGFKLELHKK